MKPGAGERQVKGGSLFFFVAALSLVIAATFICLPAAAVTASLGVGPADQPGAVQMNVTEFRQAGIALMNEKDWPGLSALLDQGLALYPQDPELHCLKGYWLRKTGNVSGAVGEVTIGITLDPKPVRYANRGYAYLALGNNTGAIRDADSAISLDPSYATAYGVRAIGLMNAGNLTAAVRDVDTALSLEPDNPLYWQLKGRVLSAGGNCTGAVEAFETSVVINPAPDLPWPGFGNATADLARIESLCATPKPTPTRAAFPPVCTACGVVIAIIALGIPVVGRKD
jgi:tetratricopeptide (TPR) repeat protein